MQIYDGDLEKIRKYNTCSVCGANLRIYYDADTKRDFLACWDWHRTHHTGIQSTGTKPDISQFTLERRREIMNQEYGEKSTALAKYQSMAVMTRDAASEIVETLWKDAPSVEKTKAVMLCQQYNLNPLMRHVYLIHFGKDWALVLGIGATRLMARRRHDYTYLDLTPRVATHDELEKVLGDEIDPNCIYQITKLKDIKSGAEVYGLGSWAKNTTAYGSDKGNSQSNMAAIRSERRALDRLYPGELPDYGEVADERYLEEPQPSYSVNIETGEVIEGECQDTGPGGNGTGHKPKPHPSPKPPPAATGKATEGIEGEDDTETHSKKKLATLEFKNPGEFYTACLKHFKLAKSQVDNEVPEYDLANAGQRKRAWQQIVAIYGDVKGGKDGR